MRKLLRANFARMWKGRLVWIGVVAYAVIGALVAIDNHKWMAQGEAVYAETLISGFALMTAFAVPVFCALFVGTEYADGTMRNKLIVGCSRGAIYISNFACCCAASLVFAAAYLIPCALLGWLLLSGFNAGILAIAGMLFNGALALVALNAIFCCVAMLIRSRSVSAVVALLALFGMLMVSASVQNSLRAPEFYDDFVLTANGTVERVDQVPNPGYLRGAKREIYQFVSDFLPTGQALQVANLEQTKPSWQLNLYALAIVAGCTAAGMAAYHRKDIQ